MNELKHYRDSKEASVKRLEYFKHNKDYNGLKRELDFLEENALIQPEYLYYYYIYFWETYDSVKAYEYYRDYMIKMPQDKRDKHYLRNLQNGFGVFHYEDVGTDEEYQTAISIMKELSKPEKENKPVIKDESFFKELKVGLISYDFRPHPVGIFIMALLKDKLNFQSVKYYIYDLNGRENEIQKIIKEQADCYTNVSAFDDEELSSYILNDALDILVDLNGLSEGVRIHPLVSRLAPIQVTWIGFPGSTALYNMDYTIVDKVSDPVGMAEKYYTEKLLYMDKTFLCFTCDEDMAEVQKEPPAVKNGYITFGSFTNTYKFSASTLRLWKKVMDALPASRLMIQSAYLLTDEDVMLQKEKFKRAGIDVKRVEFRKKNDYAAYFKNYNEVDIILDTFPFNGATTTCDSFYMGVPVITRKGNIHVSRVSTSMLGNVGLSSLAADNEEEYVRIAVELANDMEGLKVLRENLRKKFYHSPLMDHISFKIELEHKFRDIYIDYVRRSQSGNSQKIKKEVSVLLKEALISIFYMKYHLNREDGTVGILEECAELQNELCNCLKHLFKEKPEVISAMVRYEKLLSLMKQEIDKESLNVILDSFLKILGMFIGY